MLRLLFMIVLFSAVFTANSQVRTKIIGDSVQIKSNTSTAELILENSSKSVNGFLYNKGNGRTEFRNEFVQQTLTDGSTVTWNLDNGSYGIWNITDTGRTLAITNPIAYHNYKLKIVQDATGGRSVRTWPSSILWPNGTAPTLSAGANSIDMVDLFYDGTNYYARYNYRFASQDNVNFFVISNLYNSGPTVHTLTGVPAGSLIVITSACGSSLANASISSSPSLSWTKRADASGVNSGDAEIHTAVFTAGGNITVTSNFGATDAQSSVCYVIINQEATLSGASNTGANQSTPSVSVTTTRANSILICVTSDWAAKSGSQTYRSTPVIEMLRNYEPGAYTGYHYYKLAPTTTSYTMGLSAPSSQQSGTCVLEIRGK